MSMKTTHTILAVVLIALSVLVGGAIVSEGSKASAADALDVSTPAGAEVGSDVIALIQQIKTLRIDQSIFSDPAFLSLTDYTTPIPPQPVGRPNPFAPLGSVSSGGASRTR